MARAFSLASLVVVGIIVADFLIHPAGTAEASRGAARLVVPTESALLGGTQSTGIQTYG